MDKQTVSEESKPDEQQKDKVIVKHTMLTKLVSRSVMDSHLSGKMFLFFFCQALARVMNMIDRIFVRMTCPFQMLSMPCFSDVNNLQCETFCLACQKPLRTYIERHPKCVDVCDDII